MLTFEGSLFKQDDVRETATSGLTAPSYVTLATSADLANERVLTAGAGISLTDTGAGGTITIAAGGGGTYQYRAATNGTKTTSGLAKVGSTINIGAGSITAGGKIDIYFNVVTNTSVSYAVEIRYVENARTHTLICDRDDPIVLTGVATIWQDSTTNTVTRGLTNFNGTAGENYSRKGYTSSQTAHTANVIAQAATIELWLEGDDVNAIVAGISVFY